MRSARGDLTPKQSIAARRPAPAPLRPRQRARKLASQPNVWRTRRLYAMAPPTSVQPHAGLRAPRLRHETPFRILVQDLADERAATVPYPPGDTRFSLARTKRFIDEPLPLLLEAYERYGPIFT